MGIEIIKFIIYSLIIVLISKYILVKLLRNIGETLGFSPKVVGEIAGFATSIPELLTVAFSAFSGLIGASVYNILSSNIINSVQYVFSLRMSGNKRYLKSKLIRIDLILVIATILIPIFLLIFHLELTVNIVLLFILFFIIFYRISYKSHQKHNKKIVKEVKDTESKSKRIFFMFKYLIYLILVGIVLFLIGDKLSIVLEGLANTFKISEFILGIALGFVTSIPELITFFESQKYYTENESSDDEFGVVEATNNLLFSNMFNLFIIQSIGAVIFVAVR